MPRTRDFARIEGNVGYVETQMKDGDKQVDVKYSLPATPNAFKAYVASLPDAKVPGDDEAWEGELADVWSMFWSGKDMRERASLREQAAAESTIIMVGKKPIDLMALDVNKAVAAINGTFAVAAATGKDPQNAYVVARRKLLEGGKVVEQGGAVVVKK